MPAVLALLDKIQVIEFRRINAPSERSQFAEEKARTTKLGPGSIAVDKKGALFLK